MSKILIVEKDEKLRNLLEEKLMEEGYGVDSASRGTTALEKVDDFQPDLIVLSSKIKDIKGESICWEIRKEYPDLPVVLIFEKLESEKIRRFFKAGADDFVVKPMDIDNFLARIRARLVEQNTVDTVLKCADLKLDTKKLKVERAGKEIKLTPREFKLLKFLLSNKGKVLTRDVILNRVWSYGSQIESRAVDVYIGYLREKIDEGDDKKLIKTIRGFGYTIRE